MSGWAALMPRYCCIIGVCAVVAKLAFVMVAECTDERESCAMATRAAESNGAPGRCAGRARGDEREPRGGSSGSTTASGTSASPDALAEALGARLRALGFTLATAESCTGGLVAAAVTSVAGSSAWFGSGFVTYSNAAKTAMLGVREETLARHGAVSEAVVREMAAGARARAGADVALSVSGVAGPGGGSEAKPVGTVWLAWTLPDGTLESELRRFAGERSEVRERAVRNLLRGTLRRLDRFSQRPS